MLLLKPVLVSCISYKIEIILVPDVVNENEFLFGNKYLSMKDVFLDDNRILDKVGMSLPSAQQREVNFGCPFQGIWSVESDGSFVYTVDVSRGNGDEKLCTTGDSLGHVKLFAYPCVGEQSMLKSFIGHVSHVQSLTFTQDNKYIISLGGNDYIVFQWCYIPKFPDTTVRLVIYVDPKEVDSRPIFFWEKL